MSKKQKKKKRKCINGLICGYYEILIVFEITRVDCNL